MAVEASIIIRTLNEAKYLERLLVGIRQQRYKDWETILIDSGSVDATLDIASKYVDKIQHIPKEEFTFGRSLNLGCQHAEGRYLVLVSAHTYPANNSWLGNLLEPFEDQSIGMVYGRQQGVAASRIAEIRDLQHEFGQTSVVMLDKPAGHNANAAIPRDLWLDIPFDESLTGLEDVDWAKKIQRRGLRVHYAADSLVYHIHQESVAQVYRRFRIEGVAYKKIFPGYGFSRVDLIKGAFRSIAGDILYGIRFRMPPGNLMEIPTKRLAEFLGTYHGVRQQRHLRKRLRRRLDSLGFRQSAGARTKGTERRPAVEADGTELRDHEVRIKIAYAGVFCGGVGMDYGSLQSHRSVADSLPTVRGREYSGVIVGTGLRVKGYRAGDGVAGEPVVGCGECNRCVADQSYRCLAKKDICLLSQDGTHVNYLTVPAEHIHKIPEEVPLQFAALVGPIAACINGLDRLSPQSGERVCVLGAGVPGNVCAQLLQQRGVHVTVVDENVRRLKLVQKYYVDTLSSFEVSGKYDYLIDTTGDPGVLSDLERRLDTATQVLLLGYDHGQTDTVWPGDLAVSVLEVLASDEVKKANWNEAIRLIQRRKIDLFDIAGVVLPLHDYRMADAMLQNGEPSVLLCVSEDLAAL